MLLIRERDEIFELVDHPAMRLPPTALRREPPARPRCSVSG
jgi:hypothetical protein